MNYWQENTINELLSLLEPNEDILALLLFGSCSRLESQPDYWSDIDILIVVKENTLPNYFPTINWLEQFGRIYTFDQSSDEFKYVTRVCFEDFRRIDFISTTEENLAKIKSWSRNPFLASVRTLFSRSEIVDEIASRSYKLQKLPSFSTDLFNTLVRKFRFKSMLAIYKVVRNDSLIALHLALDLIRDCSELGMLLRDRTEGSNFHKDGDIGNQIVAQLQKTQKPFSIYGILEIVEQSNIVFDKLASEWSNEYQENRQPLLAWIEKARDTLHKSPVTSPPPRYR